MQLTGAAAGHGLGAPRDDGRQADGDGRPDGERRLVADEGDEERRAAAVECLPKPARLLNLLILHLMLCASPVTASDMLPSALTTLLMSDHHQKHPL